MTFTQDDIRRIKDTSEGRLVDVISDFHELRRKGKDYVCDCPVCKGKDKLSISPAKKYVQVLGLPDRERKKRACLSDVGGGHAIL